MKYIHRVAWTGSRPGLERITALLHELGDPQDSLRFVHVAGTNGKGSFCSMLDSVLRKAGFKTGLYTSPYIERFNERMAVDGEPISDTELSEITARVRVFADKMADPPTEFELITAIAMEYFFRNGCDIVVLEVGMGGELDSTNVIDSPEAAVICAIDLDHTSFLGNTVEEVAHAKAGIIKGGTTAVLYEALPSVTKVFENRCRNVGAELVKADFSSLCNIRHTLTQTVFDCEKYKDVSLSLVGSYQPYNAFVAISTIEVLRKKGYDISDAALYEGLACVRWPGRFEILGENPVFVLDGAHNPHGMRAAVESFRAHFGDRKIHFVVGAMADKDVSGMMAMLLPLADEFVAVKPDNPRAMEADELAGLLTELGARAEKCDGIDEAVKLVLSRAGDDGIVACLGSLYFSAEIRRAYLKLRG